MLDEGRRTMGVWLPLAFAELATELRAVIRLLVKNPYDIPIPKTSEVLKSWALPLLSGALKAEEESLDAIALYKAVERLAKAKDKRE